MNKQLNKNQTAPISSPKTKDDVINKALLEMEEIEESVLLISEMSGQVSEQFSKIGNTVKNFGQDISGFITDNRKSLFNNKEDAEFAATIAELGAEAIGSAINFVGGLFSDYKRNKQLKKLLIAKQQIANDKIKVVSMLFKKMEHNINIFHTLVIEYVNAEYDIEELKDGLIQSKHFDTMRQAMEQYKKAALLFFLTQFMLAEYNAWLGGEQESGYKYPDESILHGHILYTTLYPPIKSYNKSEDKSSDKLIAEELYTYLIRSDAKYISGRFLFLIIDEKLTSKYLLETDKYAFMRISIGSQVCRTILYKNEAYTESQKGYYELKNLEDQTTADIIYYIYRVGIFLCTAFYGYLNYKNHGWWFIPTLTLGYWFVPRKIGISIYRNYKQEMSTKISNCKIGLIHKLKQIMKNQ